MFQIAQCDSNQDYAKWTGNLKVVGSNDIEILCS